MNEFHDHHHQNKKSRRRKKKSHNVPFTCMFLPRPGSILHTLVVNGFLMTLGISSLIDMKRMITYYYSALIHEPIFTSKFTPVLRNEVVGSDEFEIRLNLYTKWTHGIKAYAEGLLEATKYYTGRCRFFTDKSDYVNIARNRKPRRFFFMINGGNLHRMLHQLSERFHDKIKQTIFGPLPVPFNWTSFPDPKLPLEEDFGQTLSMMGSYAVHSKRVENYLARRANLTSYPAYKFAKIRACTMLSPGVVKAWSERRFDVIFFEKYADEDHSRQGAELYEHLIKAGLTVTRMGYKGAYEYTQEHMKEVANDSRFIVYFSFWDTGAIGLLEIQNFGVYSFTAQDDLIDREHKTGAFIEGLAGDDMKAACDSILKKMKEIMDSNPKSEEFAQISQHRNSCVRALEDLCDHVQKMPTI